MAINIGSEKLMSLMKLSKMIPTHPCYNTLRKWVNEGQISKTTGKLVFLEAVQSGGRVYSSRAAYHRYLIQLNGYDAQWLENDPKEERSTSGR